LHSPKIIPGDAKTLFPSKEKTRRKKNSTVHGTANLQTAVSVTTGNLKQHMKIIGPETPNHHMVSGSISSYRCTEPNCAAKCEKYSGRGGEGRGGDEELYWREKRES
jgi:hypothetical protein